MSHNILVIKQKTRLTATGFPCVGGFQVSRTSLSAERSPEYRGKEHRHAQNLPENQNPKHAPGGVGANRTVDHAVRLER